MARSLKKVWIVTVWEFYDGYSLPIAVFKDLKEAEDYTDKHPLVNEDAMYDILEREVK